MRTKELYITLLLFSMLYIEVFSQSVVLKFGEEIVWYQEDLANNSNLVQSGSDTLNQDTIIILRDSYYRINIHRDTLETLLYDECLYSSNCSDNGYNFSGKYKKFFESGQIKEIGDVVCNLKQGEWITFFEDGTINKYENFESFELSLGHSTPYNSGLYKEYFPNGKIKISGLYRVVQKWSEVLSVNYSTYDIVSECCSWVTTSIKYGIWKEYDIRGHLINQEEYNLKVDSSSTYRDIPDIYKK